jgi:flagellar basal-body rod protein FlgB
LVFLFFPSLPFPSAPLRASGSAPFGSAPFGSAQGAVVRRWLSGVEAISWHISCIISVKINQLTVIAMLFDNLLGIHEQALQLREKRSELLASNLANADTPGYKARDFDFNSLLAQETQQQQQGQLATTQAGHMQVNQSGLVPATAMGYRIPEQASLDGNSVNAEKEKVEFAANALRYQASLRFLNGKISAMKQALSSQG